LLDEHWQVLVDTHSAVSRAEIEEAAKEVLVWRWLKECFAK